MGKLKKKMASPHDDSKSKQTKRLLDISHSSSDRKLAQKIVRSVKSDRFHKLGSFLTFIHPDSILNDKGYTGLHLACKSGHADCINVFLRNGASKISQDYDGNTGLHLAAKFCMKRCIQGQPYNLKDLVNTPFLISDPDLVQLPNKKGTTPQKFLDALTAYNYDKADSSSPSSSSGGGQQEDDWMDKLRENYHEEHFEDCGKFEDYWHDDDAYKNAFNETYDQWAERIAAEFSRRYRNKEKSRPDSASSQQRSQSPEKPPLKKRLVLKPLPKKSKLMLTSLFAKGSLEVIKVKDLPFKENSSPESIVQELLSTVDEKGDRKKSIKEMIRLWHPDKFTQMLQHRIHPGHKDEIIRIVTHVSQALLNFGRQ